MKKTKLLANLAALAVVFAFAAINILFVYGAKHTAAGSNVSSQTEVFTPVKAIGAGAVEFDNVAPVRMKAASATQVIAVKVETQKAAEVKTAVSKPAASKTAVKTTVKAAKKVVVSKKSTVASSSKKKVVASSRGGRPEASSAKANELIGYAEKFLGVDYVFGGASPSGFDCSGFTMYVFKEFGIDLPHSAKAQAEMGRAVSRSDLEPGDLVFFHTYASGISHVGIYIGGGKFLEASSSRGIAITDLSSSYYEPRYMGATRIIE